MPRVNNGRAGAAAAAAAASSSFARSFVCSFRPINVLFGQNSEQISLCLETDWRARGGDGLASAPQTTEAAAAA